jgi:hypothetical protein
LPILSSRLTKETFCRSAVKFPSSWFKGNLYKKKTFRYRLPVSPPRKRTKTSSSTLNLKLLFGLFFRKWGLKRL